MEESALPLWTEYYPTGFIDLSNLKKWPPKPFQKIVSEYKNTKETGAAVLESGGTHGIIHPERELFPSEKGTPKVKLSQYEHFSLPEKEYQWTKILFLLGLVFILGLLYGKKKYW